MPGFETDSPLSRPLALTQVPPEGLEVDIVATPAERTALARLNDLPEVLSLHAKLRARRWRGDGLEVTGDITARLRLTCVITLEDFDADTSEPIEVRFAPPRDEAQRSRRHQTEAPADEAGEDAPDPLVGGAVDLGAIVSEFLTLAIDPYPRKPGAAFSGPAAPDHGCDPGKESPFAALRDKKP